MSARGKRSRICSATSPYNFTTDEGGYLDRLTALRKTDPARLAQDPGAAAARGSCLSSSHGPWQDTSEGLRCRLLALSQNPHLEADIATIRRALGLALRCYMATSHGS